MTDTNRTAREEIEEIAQDSYDVGNRAIAARLRNIAPKVVWSGEPEVYHCVHCGHTQYPSPYAEFTVHSVDAANPQPEPEPERCASCGNREGEHMIDCELYQPEPEEK